MTTATTADRDRAGQHRQRIVSAAAELTTRSGWASVTMARIADEVGVSRQTVYNEVGSKQALAEAMVQHELASFLSVVHEAFDDNPAEVVQAIHAAAFGVLDMARSNELLRAVVSATHGADTELLPLLTTHSEPLLGTAVTTIAGRLSAYPLPFEERRLAAAVDVFVRTVLSHVMQPTGSAQETADDIAWVVARVLEGSA